MIWEISIYHGTSARLVFGPRLPHSLRNSKCSYAKALCQPAPPNLWIKNLKNNIYLIVVFHITLNHLELWHYSEWGSLWQTHAAALPTKELFDPRSHFFGKLITLSPTMMFLHWHGGTQFLIQFDVVCLQEFFATQRFALIITGHRTHIELFCYPPCTARARGKVLVLIIYLRPPQDPNGGRGFWGARLQREGFGLSNQKTKTFVC